jgi:hypothetical protein
MWTIRADMASPANTPHKGTIEVLAAQNMSVTIDTLTPGTPYFTTVVAVNREVPGVETASAPTSAIPARRPPGKPVVAVTIPGGSSRRVAVAISPPLVPDHGLYCSGGGSGLGFTLPNPCPDRMGLRTYADGGSIVTKYEIQESDEPSFSTGHTTSYMRPVSRADLEGASSALVFYIDGLDSNIFHYFRVFAHNAIGPGPSCANAGSGLCDGVALRVQPNP